MYFRLTVWLPDGKVTECFDLRGGPIGVGGNHTNADWYWDLAAYAEEWCQTLLKENPKYRTVIKYEIAMIVGTFEVEHNSKGTAIAKNRRPPDDYTPPSGPMGAQG